ncbi:MAG: hypothetical protein JRI68_27605 [Deltaproteobacteria bacterium]|nr:hypothetical protein [Deltaproteobacteria bacterium]
MKKLARLGSYLAATALAITTWGCSDDETAREHVVEPAPAVAWPHLTCDALVPSYCAFPFPSNVYTAPDESSVTGRRVVLDDATMPVAQSGAIPDMASLLPNDGFSAAAALLAELPGATDEGLPSPFDPAASLADDCPTVILNAETGERVAHFSELDKSMPLREERALMIRPVERLEDGTRYIVAIRGIRGAAGPLPPSPAFEALRDLWAYDADPSIDERRPLYADIFQRLAAAGVPRHDLQLAWDFTTSSRDNNTGFLVHMRDEALAWAGDRIEGTMEVPLSLDDPGPGGRLVFGDDGLPEPNPDQPTDQVPFLVLIPHSATTTPAALLQYGHGLLGTRNQIQSGNFRWLIDDYGYVMFGLDLRGMAEDDELWIADQLAVGAMDKLTAMFERQHQGMLDYLLAMRMMSRGFAADPTYGGFINPDERYYHGISQGGIFGPTYLALSTDVTRAVLGVAGMPYSLLLKRSVDFGPFVAFLTFSFPDPRDHLLLLAVVQMFWDRTEPNGYAPYVHDDPLPGTSAHDVLIRTALGDHQVSTLGGQIMARAIGAKHLDTGVRDVFGLEVISSATEGSAYVEYDFGLPPDPECNITMTACDDPHDKIRKLPEAAEQLDTFLRTGTVTNLCPGNHCSYPEQSGCEANDATPLCPE